jgi:phosphoribosyl 1,2-cyclic phosphodiesterase
MKVKLWGTRGSIASPGADTTRYGGNTSCVEVRGTNGTVLVLDAGTGIRRLGMNLPDDLRRVDILLTHLHMDHIQGLGFFPPLYNPDIKVHIWGPPSTTTDLRTRLMRYLSPPLFPVHLRELDCHLTLHEVPCGTFQIGEFRVDAQLVCHPGPTVGFRVTQNGHAMAFVPDHEPALGADKFPTRPEWISGYSLAHGVDLLIHDAQYRPDEYSERIGWGHCTVGQAVEFAKVTEAKKLCLFHHDPAHNDEELDLLVEEATASAPPSLRVAPGTEGTTFRLHR